MGKKRDATTINFDLDCDRVTEALKKRKKKKSSKVQLSGKAYGEGSARTREIEDPSAAAGTVATFTNHDGAEPSHLHMPVTPTPGVTVDHDGFHLSSMTSSLRQTLGGLGYDPDNLTTGTDVCDQLYESTSRVSIYPVFFVSRMFLLFFFLLLFFLDVRTELRYQGCLRRDSRAVGTS